MGYLIFKKSSHFDRSLYKTFRNNKNIVIDGIIYLRDNGGRYHEEKRDDEDCADRPSRFNSTTSEAAIRTGRR
ncbi:hypothetical protein LBR02_10970 [Levilactobacillus brevis]|nr:hypothetical protein LBR02_10970 [Levilactobacillus brevis]GEB06264.1 hypothetical protein LBR03_11510 [Levilactobacillus brevis]